MEKAVKSVLLVMLAALTGNFAGCENPVVKQENKLKADAPMIQISKSVFGTVEGREIYLYEITNPGKMTIRLTNYGGIVTSVVVPDRNGKMEDVVNGFGNLQSYLDGHPYFGCITGRYANRIADGRFSLGGRQYQLAQNAGGNHLHGGIRGFDKVVWDSKEYRHGDEAGVELTYLSPDGEEGYPGNLKVRVVCSMTPDNGLKIDYYAESDAPTPINLTHHGYFNLKGEGSGDIMGHLLMIDADRYSVVNESLIPTGELRDVTGTAFDFRTEKPVGKDFSQVEGGYDHNFALNNRGEFAKVAVLSESTSGRRMEVFTSEPGMQFYAGNFLDGTLTGKSGRPYGQHFALCLETQHFPDSPNQPAFPGTILYPGKQYRHTTVYKFSTF